jgi:hypothetical protein
MTKEQWVDRMHSTSRNEWDALFREMGPEMALEVSAVLDRLARERAEKSEYLYRRATGQLDRTACQEAEKSVRRGRR